MFNGNIANAKEIKEELAALPGSAHFTRDKNLSDTEVLGRLIEHYRLTVWAEMGKQNKSPVNMKELYQQVFERVDQKIDGACSIVLEDTEGNVVGRHDGIHHFTVGQRHGLGLSLGRRVYVTRIEAETGLAVLQFPKLEEFFIGFRVAA